MGEIKVTVQTEKLLQAINNLSIAIRDLAKALGLGTQVDIKDCTFTGLDPGAEAMVVIETAEEVTETKIEKTE